MIIKSVMPSINLFQAARLVYRLTRFMPRPLFRALSQNMSVGVFVHRQDLPSAFPEYTSRADTPNCASKFRHGRPEGPLPNDLFHLFIYSSRVLRRTKEYFTYITMASIMLIGNWAMP